MYVTCIVYHGRVDSGLVYCIIINNVLYHDYMSILSYAKECIFRFNISGKTTSCSVV